MLAKHTIMLIMFLLCFQWTETKDKVQGKKGKEAEEDQTAKLKFTAGEFYTYMIAQPFRITVSYVISQSI